MSCCRTDGQLALLSLHPRMAVCPLLTRVLCIQRWWEHIIPPGELAGRWGCRRECGNPHPAEQLHALCCRRGLSPAVTKGPCPLRSAKQRLGWSCAHCGTHGLCSCFCHYFTPSDAAGPGPAPSSAVGHHIHPAKPPNPSAARGVGALCFIGAHRCRGC